MTAEYTPDEEELVTLTSDLLAFDTQNPPGDTRDIIEWIAAYLGEADIPSTIIAEDPAKPNIVAQLPGKRPERLLFLGHVDTVPYAENDWTFAPLGERVYDRVYGRGATDMKGPLAAMLSVFRFFAQSEEQPPVTLELAAVSDEEIGGDAGLPAVLETDAIDPTACIVGETTCGGGRYSLSIADRGSIWMTLRATGEAAHGSRPMFGDNAIDRLYQAIEQIRTEVGNQAVPVPEAVEPIVAESIEYYSNIVGEKEAAALFRTPTINLGTMTGGDAINSVPADAVAELDIRVPPGTETTEILDDLRVCIDGCEGIVVEDVSWSIGSYVDPDEPIVRSVVKTTERVANVDLTRRSSTGGSDAKRLRNRGIPAIEFAFGTATVHGVDEYITTDALAQNAAVYWALPEAIANEWNEQSQT